MLTGTTDPADLIPPPATLKSEAKSLFTVSLPVALSSFLSFLLWSGFSVFLGRLGYLYLAAATLGDIYINTSVLSLTYGLGQASDTLVSQAVGSGNRKRAWAVTARALLIFTALTPVFILIMVASRSVLSLPFLQQDTETVELAATFVMYKIPHLWPRFMVSVLHCYLMGQGKSALPMMLTLVSLVFNLACLELLVFNTPLGFIGAPITTSISAWMELFLTVVVVVYDEIREFDKVQKSKLTRRQRFAVLLRFLATPCPCCFRMARHNRAPYSSLPHIDAESSDEEVGRGPRVVVKSGTGSPSHSSDQVAPTMALSPTDPGFTAPYNSREYCKRLWGQVFYVPLQTMLRGWPEYFKLGLPGALMVWFEWGGWEVTSLIAGMSGPEVLAAHTILTNLAIFMSMLPEGLSEAACVRVGNHLGDGNARKARQAAALAMVFCWGVALLSILVIILVREVWAGIFTTEAHVIDLVHQCIYMLSYFCFADASFYVLSGILQGAGQQHYGAIFNVISFVFLSFPASFVLCIQFDWGLYGLWLGFGLGLVCSSVAIAFVLWRLNWERVAEEAHERALLDED